MKMPFSHAPIAAGTAYELDEGFDLIDLNAWITGGHEGVTLYQVSGSSMVAEIQPGAVICVDPTVVPKNGDIIAVCHNGKNSVKRLEIQANGLYLVSSNKEYPKTAVKETDSLYVLGVVRASINMFVR